ncbi:MAG TPA: hypothetical protein VLT86_14105 [Vicinamibacterales bacterium]|nr:hypothetical protein [Vicinamibacterales bacterium]
MALEDRLRETIDEFLMRMRQELELHGQRLGRDASALVARGPQAGAADAMADVSRVEVFRRLLAAVRQIDSAASLKGVLEALSRGAKSEASRVALLLVDHEKLRCWGHFGFGAADAPFDMVVAADSRLATAVGEKRTVQVTAQPQGAGAVTPDFMRVPSGHTGVISPLVVGDNVVALLYADGPERSLGRNPSAIWIEQVEILVRHAAVRLENLTSLRTVEVFSQP